MQALITWARARSATVPELALLHHIPNGGYRHAREAARLQAEGVVAGIPDLFFPVALRLSDVARETAHGLYIEMKSAAGRLSTEQIRIHGLLRQQGYMVQVCRSWQEGARLLELYLYVPRTV